MPIKGTKQTVIVYTGALYEDAESACKQGGTTVTNKSEGSANARAVAKKNERHDAYILLARAKGYDENAELYAAPVGMYKSFCNLFWLNPKKYTVENPPKAVRELKPISAEKLCAEPMPTKSKNSAANDIILAIDSAIDCINAANVRAINEHSHFVGDALTIVRNDIAGTLSNCADGIIDAFKKSFDVYAKNFIRYSEEARAGFKTLEVIAESSIEAVELLKKIDSKLDRLDTRQEEMNERLSGLAQIETGISANVAKTVTFVDRFTKR